MGLPDIEGRYEIFLVHLTPLKLNEAKTKNEYAKRLSTLTPGFSGFYIRRNILKNKNINL